MVGCNAINIRYTREKNIAFILNEMLLHLLKAHPEDAVGSLLKYLQGADMQMLLKGGRTTKKSIEKVKKPEEVKQQPAVEKQPESKLQSKASEYQRGDGLMILNRLEFREVFRVLAYLQAMPTVPHIKSTSTVKELSTEGIATTISTNVELVKGDGLQMLSTVCSSETRHPGVELLTNSKQSNSITNNNPDQRKGAGLEVLQATSSDDSIGLRALLAAAGDQSLFSEKTGLGLKILQKAGSENQGGICLLIETLSFQQSGDGLKVLRTASKGQIGIEMLNNSANYLKTVTKHGDGLRILMASATGQTTGLSILMNCAKGSSDGLTLLQLSGSYSASLLKTTKTVKPHPSCDLLLSIGSKHSTKYLKLLVQSGL